MFRLPFAAIIRPYETDKRKIHKIMCRCVCLEAEVLGILTLASLGIRRGEGISG
jgi:hypothetical protein